MKKIKILIAFIMWLSLITIYPKANISSSLYVKTEISEEYDNYVSSVFDKLLVAQEDLNNYENVFLGEGIKLLLPEEVYTYYIYPVISNDIIIATIHVSKTCDGFASTYTQALAKELEGLKNKTTKDSPLVLIRQGDFLYAEIEGVSTLLEYHSIDNTQSRSNGTLAGLPSINTSNLEVKDVYDNLTSNKVANLAIPRAPVNKLPWTVYETQGSQP